MTARRPAQEESSDAAVVRWLLAGDPAIVWQTERDLLDLPERRYEATRRRVADTGWGARLLEQRAADGTWGGGLYNPKWTSTFYTLQLLSLLGVGSERPEAVASCQLLLERGVQVSGGVCLWKGSAPDTCVTAMLLATAAWFERGEDPRASRMLRWLLAEQMSDGGWNCRRHRGATHASFHTTTSVLEALTAWRAASPSVEPALARAERAGREFMLAHHLYRSHRTGAIARSEFTYPRFPCWWKFDVLRGLEQFRAADVAWDVRLADPVDLIESKRGKDGRWKLPSPHPGRTWFSLEQRGAPSRWITLRALRLSKWAERARVAASRAPRRAP